MTRPALFGAVGAACFALAAAHAEITAEVRTWEDRPVGASVSLTPWSNGFQRLAVTLHNSNAVPVRIRNIVLRIPINAPVTADTPLLFGGTCMGRTPMFRTVHSRADAPQARSAMFVMARTGDAAFPFIGAVSWRRFMPYLHVSASNWVARMDGERRLLQSGESVPVETLVLGAGTDDHELLRRYAAAIALENGIAAVKPDTFRGWATWDYYGRLFRHADVISNMDEMEDLFPGANLIQIDGGWWTERGDYTSPRPDLPGGVQELAKSITARGRIAGLHFDGFRGDAEAEICKQHPEYFLHDENGNLIVDTKPRSDRVMRYTFFDYSHPGARAHIAECIRVMREDWGIRYFKVDFMRYGLEEGIRSSVEVAGAIRAHDPALTSLERFRLGMQTIREAIGRENYFLGCSAFIGPAIGFVDGMRTGADISPQFDHFAPRVLGNAGHAYLAEAVFNVDCDYLVFRAAEDEDERVSGDKGKSGGSLTLNEARMWSDFASLFGNARLASDNLTLLRPERKALIQTAMAHPFMDEVVPLGYWRHAADGADAFTRLLARRGDAIYLALFNWGAAPATERLSGLGGGATLTAADGSAIPVVEGVAMHELAPRHSTVLRYDGPLSFRVLRDVLDR